MRVPVQSLRKLATDILLSYGMPVPDAQYVADSLIRAEICGYDSHGVVSLQWYVRNLRAGEANLHPNIRIEKQTATLTMVNGDLAFGQLVARACMNIGIERAASQSVTCVSFRNALHVGRLADFAEMGAQSGFITLMWVNMTNPSVVPYGGREARYGTNPFCVSVPGRSGPLFTYDVASSAVALKKLRKYIHAKEAVPEGWILDAEGRPSTDPNVMYREPKGGLLPYGGYRGYGQGLMVEVLAGILTGGGVANLLQSPILNGGLIVFLKVEDFIEKENFHRECEALAEKMKSTPPAFGFEGVRLPGESGGKFENFDMNHGEIFVSDETFAMINTLFKT